MISLIKCVCVGGGKHLELLSIYYMLTSRNRVLNPSFFILSILIQCEKPFCRQFEGCTITFSRENISFPLIRMSGYFMDNHAFRLLDVLVHLYIYDFSTSYFKNIELA